jgi:GAF domain-containing protein
MTADHIPGRTHDSLVNPPGLLRPSKPADPEGPRRAARLAQLGVGMVPDTEFDAIARRLAESAAMLTGADPLPLAMVNFITPEDHRTPEGQYFGGLFVPGETPAQAAAAITTAVKVGRTMPLDHGWCPHVIVDRRVLPLRDARGYRRWANNPVTRKVGIRAYLGGPIIEETTGIALGTVCVVAREPLHWEHDAVDLIKATAAEVAEIIRRRNPAPPPPPPFA